MKKIAIISLTVLIFFSLIYYYFSNSSLSTLSKIDLTSYHTCVLENITATEIETIDYSRQLKKSNEDTIINLDYKNKILELKNNLNQQAGQLKSSLHDEKLESELNRINQEYNQAVGKIKDYLLREQSTRAIELSKLRSVRRPKLIANWESLSQKERCEQIGLTPFEVESIINQRKIEKLYAEATKEITSKIHQINQKYQARYEQIINSKYDKTKQQELLKALFVEKDNELQKYNKQARDIRKNIRHNYYQSNR